MDGRQRTASEADTVAREDATGTVKEAHGQAANLWHKVDRRQAHEQVIDRIERMIFEGELQDGSRLPPERDLAQYLGVSRAAIREALRTLEAQGVIRAATRAGRDTGTMVSAMPSEALTRILRLHVALARFPLRDVVETRIMLERGSAQLAAAARTGEILEQMERLLEEMKKDDISRSTFNDLDTDFHVAIAEAGGNRLAADMTSAIRQAMRHPLLVAFEASLEWSTIADELRKQHGEVYRAIKNRNGDDAANKVESHIRWFFRRMGSPDAAMGKE